jgi:hypothetical protein
VAVPNLNAQPRVFRHGEITVRYTLNGRIDFRHYDAHVGIVSEETLRARAASEPYEECLGHLRIEYFGHMKIGGVGEVPLLEIAKPAKHTEISAAHTSSVPP